MNKLTKTAVMAVYARAAFAAARAFHFSPAGYFGRREDAQVAAFRAADRKLVRIVGPDHRGWPGWAWRLRYQATKLAVRAYGDLDGTLRCHALDDAVDRIVGQAGHYATIS